MIFQKNSISLTFSPWVGPGSRGEKNQKRRKKSKEEKKSRKVLFHFSLLSLHFFIMSPQTFELFKKYGFYQTTFFRKVRDTNIHSNSFLKFESSYFGI
jgi:hypothetical protein